jgi:hypothetical protein
LFFASCAFILTVEVKLGNQVYIGDRATLHATRDGLNKTGFQTLIGNNAVGMSE